MRRSLLWVAVLAASGCYSFTPMNSPTPTLGTDIRVKLTDAGSVNLAPLVGSRVESIDGRGIEANDTALVLAVTATTNRGGDVAHWNNERVTIPRSAISGFEGQRFSTRRTYVASAIVVAGALLVAKVFSIGLGLDGFLGYGGRGGKQ